MKELATSRGTTSNLDVPRPNAPPANGSLHSLADRDLGSGVSDDAQKEKIMIFCSTDGIILPRPGDGKLRYVGGVKHIVSLQKNITWEELVKRTFLRKEFVLLVAARLAGLAWIMGHVPCPILMCWDVIKWSHGLVSDGHAAPSGWFAIHGLCIDDSLSINARRRADSFVVFRLWLDIRLLSYSTVHNPWSSLIPLSRGSFDMIMGMDWLSKRKFMIVCHEKVVRVPLEGDEILRVHGERTLGAAKALMNAKLDKTKLSDISVRLRRCKNCLNNIKGCKTKVSFDLVIFCKDHQCRLLRRGAWSLFEVSVEITEEGEVKWRVKLRRARAMSMTTQSSVKDKILVTSSKASKVLGNPGEAGIRRYYNLGKICIGVIDFGGSYHLSIRCTPFEALYGRKCVYVDYVGVGTQSIERDRLIRIGVVLDNSFRSLLSDPGNWIIEI
ncbi:hypothetical protein Tco_0731292 [Tanacetum coccineum]